MTKALLVGSIAREHAIADRIAESAELYSFLSAKNPGILRKSKGYRLGNIMDSQAVLDYAKEVEPDYVIVASDDPIGAGVADPLVADGYGVVAPLKELARLESDKGFAREFMEEYVKLGVTKNFRTKDADAADEYIDSLESDFVVKPMGLTGGKGVKIVGKQLKDAGEAKAYARSVIETKSDSGVGGVIIEEKLEGEEFSLQAFVDGDDFAAMPLVQDHKPAYENDEGPMTGGMGSYSDANHSLPFVTAEEYATALKIVGLTVKGIRRKTGKPFKGILYSQFMVTRSGPYVIEYNVRFGDPEAMNVLQILKNDFNDVCMAIVEGRLAKENVEFEHLATVCKYLVPKDYPVKKVAGHKLEIDENALAKNGVKIYYGGVEQTENGIYTTGSRAVGVVSKAALLAEAEQQVERGISLINDPALRWRKDIATQASLDQKLARMRKLREAPLELGIHRGN